MHTHLTAMLAAGVLIAGGGLAFANNSSSRTYVKSSRPYVNTPATVVGTVTTIVWSYPRAFLLIEGRGPNGRLTEFRVELGDPDALRQRGWRRDTVKDGETVIVKGWYTRPDHSWIKARTLEFHGNASDNVGLTFSQATALK